MSHAKERRTNRKQNCVEALSLFLAAAARRLGAEKLVVADDQGLLIGGFGGSLRDQEDLAVFALRKRDIHAIPVGAGALTVGQAGGRPASAAEVVPAVIRILGL